MNPAALDVLADLKEGNQRFRTGVRSISALSTASQRKALADNGQKPKAVVLCCSDSRSPAEIIFDVGLGELFVVRVAGNIVAPSLIASIEFAAMNFRSPLIVVMGHSDCGAIRAAANVKLGKAKIPTENIADLVSEIEPAVDLAIARHSMDLTDDLVAEAVSCNVTQSASRLVSRSEVIRELVMHDKIAIVGGVYCLSSGEIKFQENINAEMKRLSMAKAAPYEKSNFGLHRKINSPVV